MRLDQQLDSYRVRVMNPLNILRELRRMFDPPASDDDRKVVALEALDILHNHPVITVNAAKHTGLPDAVAFIREAVEAKEGGFKKNILLLRSFMREAETALEQHFLADSFSWIEATLHTIPAGETQEQLTASYVSIERVCRDIVSVAHYQGFSLESLFHLYRLFLPREPSGAGSSQPQPDAAGAAGTANSAQPARTGAPAEPGHAVPVSATGVPASAPEPYDFAARFERLKSEILAPPREHRVVFAVSGAPKAADVCCGKFGSVVISQGSPDLTGSKIVSRLFAETPRRLFASAVVKSRDGRSAGLQAYGEIGQILDLMRFEYDTPSIRADTRFLL